MAKAYGISIYMRWSFFHTATKAKSRPPFYSPEGNSFAICYEQEGNYLGTRPSGDISSQDAKFGGKNMVGNEVCLWLAIRYKYIWPYWLGGSEDGVDMIANDVAVGLGEVVEGSDISCYDTTLWGVRRTRSMWMICKCVNYTF